MFQGEIHIKNGKIVELFHSANKLSVIVDGKKFSFGNSYASVGFTDSHLHLLYGGEFLSMPDLTQTKSEAECISILKQKPFYRGNWLFARGWNQENWNDKNFPTKSSLDKAFPNKPVCLIRQDGHCLWVNSKALEICGITKETPEPKGGKIVRNETGEPIGILIDEAIELVRPFLPNYSTQQYLDFLKNSITYLAKYGITSVHDIDVDPEFLPIYKEYFFGNYPKLNLKIFLTGKKFEEQNFKNDWENNDFFKIVGAKYYMDGAFGSFGGLLFEPYSDHHQSCGLQLITSEELMEVFLLVAKNKLGIAIHSIGDKATNIILNTYQKFCEQNTERPRFVRIEHCQLVLSSDIPRFKSLNITPSIQPIHFISDYEMAINRLGSRTKYAYPWKSFFDYDIKPCSGSDYPIENPNPLKGIYSLINRKRIDTRKLFGDEEIDLTEALKTYTVYPAISIGEKPDEIKEGNPANIVILNKSPFKIDVDEIEKIEVLATISQGEFIYQQ